jgi:ferredoxin-NADP reductase
MICRAQIDGKTVARKYTPISRADLKRASFDLLIKIYFKNPPQFPEGGLMSQHVNSLKIGDKIKVTLPFGRFNYLGKSTVQIKQL